MKSKHSSALVFLLLASSLALGQSSKTSLLSYFYTGEGKPGSSGREFVQVMEHDEVQRLLLDIASEPRDKAFVESALQGSGVSQETLRTLRLIRLQGDKCSLAFILFTRTDLDKIRAVAEVQGKKLADILLVRRNKIQTLLEHNPQPGVDWKTVANFILGCVSLDWDGLNLMEEKGYLASAQEGSFIPQAKQTEGGGSIRGLYWGSHNYHSTIAVTSFGDHASLPRNALPDFLWNLSLGETKAPEPLKSTLLDAANELIRQRAGAIMLALRDRARTSKELGRAAGLTEEETTKLLEFLIQLCYVKKADGRYGAVIPVLTKRDKVMVTQLRRLGREAMSQWIDEHYTEIVK
jgi:hypothetical protein